MAGGKETPRQKMIGMMYLVLTALLALNVSKEIIQAFVSIDENVQDANAAVNKKSTYSFASLEEVANDKSEPGRQKKAQFWLEIAKQIKEQTDLKISSIDDLKAELIKAIGEDPNSMVTEEAGRKRYNLALIDAKDKYDEVMNIMIGSEGITKPNPNGKGMELWNNILDYRAQVTKIMATYDQGEGKDKKSYSFDPSNPSDRSSCHPEDSLLVGQIWAQLTLVEKADIHNGEIKDVHWVGRTFDHAPIVAAIAQLSSVQTNLLNAEAEILGHIRAKVGGGEYSFNKIEALCYGQEYANAGDSVEFQILMAAFDSNKNPRVEIDGPDGKAIAVKDVRDGKAYYRFKASSNDSITGTISIQNKSGIWKPKKFAKSITVGKPQGVVSLPEMNVLYKGYQNKVEGAATGFQTYSLSGSGCSVSKSGQGWVATVSKTSKAREAKISITGKNADGSSANLGSFPFRVQPMPKPQVYLGNLENGGSYDVSTVRSQAALFAKYGPGIPLNASFSVDRWNISSSTGEREISGKGKILSGAAKGLLKQARKGSVISIFVEGSGPGGKFRQSSSIKVK